MDIFTFMVDLLIGLWVLAVIVAIVRAWQAMAREPSTGTEALRQAMLRYRSIFTRSIGSRPTEPDDVHQESRRREMA